MSEVPGGRQVGGGRSRLPESMRCADLPWAHHSTGRDESSSSSPIDFGWWDDWRALRDADRSPTAVRGGIVSRGELVERLAAAARVVIVSAPAGSGKTFLLRSWIAEARLSDSTAWVSVTRARLDPQT